MKTSRLILTTLVSAIGVTSVVRLVAQSSDARPEWEILVRAPVPDGIEPIISVNALTMPAQPVAEHSHAGPTIGYIVHGEIENQVEPDPLSRYKPGGFFSEAPRHTHKVMRNLGAEPAK